jgi:hypothetical protein
MPYALITSHSILLLKSVSGISPSKGFPADDGLFSSFLLYYYNDLNLLINITSLPLIPGTI